MRLIRRFVYRAGFRPRPGSIFYSPSIAWAMEGEKAMRVAIEVIRRD